MNLGRFALAVGLLAVPLSSFAETHYDPFAKCDDIDVNFVQRPQIGDSISTVNACFHRPDNYGPRPSKNHPYVVNAAVDLDPACEDTNVNECLRIRIQVRAVNRDVDTNELTGDLEAAIQKRGGRLLGYPATVFTARPNNQPYPAE